jgi:hypothetical protein
MFYAKTLTKLHDLTVYQTADHPTLSPDFCHPERRVQTAGEFG